MEDCRAGPVGVQRRRTKVHAHVRYPAKSGRPAHPKQRPPLLSRGDFSGMLGGIARLYGRTTHPTGISGPLPMQENPRQEIVDVSRESYLLSGGEAVGTMSRPVPRTDRTAGQGRSDEEENVP